MFGPPGLTPLLQHRDDVFLVGDVGGTNCRLALARCVDGRVVLDDPQTYQCRDFPRAEDAIERYRAARACDGRLAAIVIAVAGPVRDGAVQATNMHWALTENSLEAHYARQARLINDYTALALSVAHLGPGDLRLIGPDPAAEPGGTIAVVGAGTGFGASALRGQTGDRGALSGEGGHIAFAPTSDIEVEILRVLLRRFGRVSIERLLSGPGIINLYDALVEIEGAQRTPRRAEDIVGAAATGDLLCSRVLDRFCSIYGAVAGDFALIYGARGGVYLGGGIAPAIAERLAMSRFRVAFESKGRLAGYAAAIPTRIIMHPFPALVGAAALAAQMADQERWAP